MAVSGAKFLGLSAIRPAMPWQMRAHSHPFFEMILVVRGTQRVAVQDRTYHAGAGDVLLYCPGVVHREWSEGGRKLETFCLSFEWPDCPGNLPVASHDGKGRLRVLLDWLAAELRTRTRVTDEMVQSLLNTVIAHYTQLSMNIEEDFVERVRSYLHDNLTAELNLADLAGSVNMSKYHFLRKYKRVTGRTPMEDLRIIRLERARELILTTAQPLKSIPQQVGLSNVYHMTRLFRRHMDVTPGSLRKVAGRR